MAYPKITMESTNPYNGLDWLVARDEGLFEKEGLEVEFVKHAGPIRKTDVSITDWNKVSSSAGHASTMELGGANIFNACEWGNYRRAQDTDVGLLQLGRRAGVPCGAIVVRPDSDVYTPQQLANKTIAVPFHAGTHYLTLQLLEGFVPDDEVKLVSSGLPGERFRSMMSGEVDACSVREPWNTVAEKAGCRTIVQGFYNGTDSATPEIDAETYAALTRALSEAVRRINADKKSYLHYFIEYDQAPEVQALTVDDFNLSRIQFIVPGKAIPENELQRTYDWMVKRDLIDADHAAGDLVNIEIMAPADD